MGRSKKLRRKVLLISVFLMIFLVAYGDFMGIEVQAEQKQETMELVKPMEESQTVELQEKPGAEENSEGDAFEPETLQIISDAFLESYGENIAQPRSISMELPGTNFKVWSRLRRKFRRKNRQWRKRSSTQR